MDNDDEHYDVLANRQTKNDKVYDTSKNFASFLIWPTEVVRQEDGGPWMHDTVVGRGDNNHSNRLTKTVCIINKNSKHIKATLITAKQYLRDQLTKHTEDPLDKILK